MTSSQIVVYTAGGPGGGQNGPGSGSSGPVPSMSTQQATANSIAALLGSNQVIELSDTGASLQHAAPGRQWSGPVYVATPQLLAAFGIKSSQVNPDADILSMRPGLAGISKMQLIYHGYFGPSGPGNGQQTFPCPAGQCLANPVIQEVSALPSGTSVPNTVITSHAIKQLGLHPTVDGWLIMAPHNLTAAQVTDARLAAAAQGMTVETRSSIPSLAVIVNWATVFGIFLALGILAMSVGLIRSETASDLRTLTATGADAWTRRTITAVTAGALGLVGAVLGMAGAYIGAIAYSFDNQLDGLGSLTDIPLTNLLVILIGMPVIAAVAGWLLAGREPGAIARQPGT
jgi:putative ABC transport system permease protein